MKRASYLYLAVALAFTLASATVIEAVSTVASSPSTALPIVHSQGTNLLLNGSMEDGFYWKYPNHFVANGWLRWWKGDGIPEYDDARAWRPWTYDGKHVQVHFRWGVPYTAGIYQQVSVQPCTFYEFNIYGRNHSGSGANHYARVGLDPHGRAYNTMGNPRVDDLPADIVWSPYQTFVDTWGQHSTTAESQGDIITAITYASPEPGFGFYDTFWDAGWLGLTSPPTGRIPYPESSGPDGFITSVVSDSLPGAIAVGWETSAPSSTQVWYRILSQTSPVTPTSTLSNTEFLPVVMANYRFPNLDSFTALDQTPVTSHLAIIGGLDLGQTVEFVALSRRLDEGSCLTSSSEFFQATMTTPFSRVHLPAVTR
jgi:hypothetical protein